MFGRGWRVLGAVNPEWQAERVFIVRYKYHTGTDADFETVRVSLESSEDLLRPLGPQDLGRALRADVNALASSLNLSTPIGSAPQDYFLARSMPGAKDSLFTMLMEEVLPRIVTDDEVDDGQERLFLANSGSQRYDVVRRTSQWCGGPVLMLCIVGSSRAPLPATINSWCRHCT